MDGFDHLRSAYENFVIEKLFKKVVLRSEERVQMLNLKKVNYRPEVLTQIQENFEMKLSAACLPGRQACGVLLLKSKCLKSSRAL